MSILHILNGDSTSQSFADTGLDGEILVWREVLSEGPLETDIASGSFWRRRMDWICSNERDTPDSYHTKVLDGLAQLDKSFDEIDLWFEFDLHCQLNMLGVMNYLRQRTDLSGPAIFLVCPADFPGKPKFRGMGELNGEELASLYDNIRVQLSELDFIVAAEAWEVYVSCDQALLESYLRENNTWGGLHALKPALKAQLTRLQINAEGLNGVEQKLLEIYRSGHTNRIDLMRTFWDTETIYGMGDMELDIYLNRLKAKGLINLSQ